MAIADIIGGDLPERAIRDIVTFAQQHANLADIVAESMALAPDISPDTLVSAVSRKIGISQSESRALFRTFENFNTLKQDLGSAEEVHTYVQGSLEAAEATEWNSHKREIVAAIEAYNGDNPVAISYKARQLSYNHEKLLVDAEILTDARPVFDATGERIVEYVITHTLAATFSATGRSGAVHLAMDAEDVLKLLRACERATLKARTLRKSMLAHGVQAKVLNDDDDR